MASDTEFFDDYLLLRPEEGGILDLFRILCSCDVDKNRFIECPRGIKMNDARRRWLIFVSLLVQKVLLSLRKPLAGIGLLTELWLNMLSENKNFLGLLLNFIRGRVAIPDKESATFKSMIGLLDGRFEVDKDIKHGDDRYNAALSVMAAKLAYENENFVQTTVQDFWKMEFIKFYNCRNDYQERLTTQAFMFCDKAMDPELIVVAFRGTEPFDADAWCTDLDFSWYELPGMGKVHGGFMKALGLQKGGGWPKEIGQNGDGAPFCYYSIRDKLRGILQKNEKARVMITGHSLGRALAILFPAILELHRETLILERIKGVYTFGQPRVGDEKFGEFVKGYSKLRYFRFVYSNDIVPRLPYDDSTLLFKHFGTCLYYNSCYKGKIVADEPNKNYFSFGKLIPKYVNATWEFARSFIITYTKGSNYKEGWTLKLYRGLGLVIPGLSAHATQDYVNITRLGTLLITSHVNESTKLD